MAEIRATPLGAGQDVGRSCILLSLGGKNIMLDCGMHMGYNDSRRFPDFTYITEAGGLTEHLDCVIISHFHLDHCGALPYFSEMVGYDGPIYMTHPTKAIAPILLEDFRKISVDKKGETNFFTSQMIKECMKKVVAVNLHQIVQVDSTMSIKAYYAGHVLGAAMFEIRVGQQSVVYTGDYNMTPDRHLGAAWIDKCRPDLLITESTYATTIRDSKRCRERDFLKSVHETVEKGGKVLIPVFALGRAQELCILLETFWERMNLTAPIYFTTGMTEKANHYYKLFVDWTNQNIKKTFVQRNMFEFKHIKPFDQSYLKEPGPMVVFATPGMLHAGQSLNIFKAWAPNDQNIVIIPGYCVQGTVGNKVLSGQKRIEIYGKMVEVKMQVQYMSFSAHADAKGIMQLIRMCSPRHVMLVHGEGEKMEFLHSKIEQEFGIPCYYPANGETSNILTCPPIPVDVSTCLLKRQVELTTQYLSAPAAKRAMYSRPVSAVVTMDPECSLRPRLIALDEAATSLGVFKHDLSFTAAIPVTRRVPTTVDTLVGQLKGSLESWCPGQTVDLCSPHALSIGRIAMEIKPAVDHAKASSSLAALAFQLNVSWPFQDEAAARQIVALLRQEEISSPSGLFQK